MPNLEVDADIPELTPAQSLTGWRREWCLELLGDGQARVFVRAVENASLKAAELKLGVLFHPVGARFRDLTGCVEAVRSDLERLVETARRVRPSNDNLYSAVVYDRSLWEQVQNGIERWTRR